MNSPDLEQLDIQQLEQLIEGAKALLEIRLRERKARAMMQARAILEEAGVSPRELARTKADKKQGLVVKQGVTYVNPDNPSESWTAGKGRRPKWLSALAVNGGAALEVR